MTSMKLYSLSRTRSALPSASARHTRCNCAVPGPIVVAPKETMQLGSSGLEVSAIGIGAWSWGDRSGYWGYGGAYGEADNLAAYQAAVDAGFNFIDTAEVYGFGKSEELISTFMQSTGTNPIIATKFAPLPWRFTAGSVVDACRSSLARLGLKKVGLYMIHWPGFLIQAFSNDEFLRGLVLCSRLGLCDAVGVSNFNVERLRHSQAFLQRDGVSIAANQVQYSLLYRAPEKNGLLDTCRELGITVTAYSPLAQGLLTGKYKPGSAAPAGPRAAVFSQARLIEIQPLIALMEEIGEAHGGKSPAQVALNWCLCKGTVPLAGAKNPRQVEEIAGAYGWRLTAEEVAFLDTASDKISSSPGAPFEKW